MEPSRGPAKEAKVADLLMTLKSLRWMDIVSAKGDDAARYGLDRPELEVTSTFKQMKGELRKEGYDVRSLRDPIFVMMPGSRDYVRLSPELFEKISLFLIPSTST